VTGAITAGQRISSVALTKSYAAAFAPTVRVSTFAPPAHGNRGRLNRPDWRSGQGEELIAATPLGRIPDPAELAGTTLFLATDNAAHMNGVFLTANGGLIVIGA
jgi:3-oxoacyl-[acyl-carrier protein] reductase